MTDFLFHTALIAVRLLIALGLYIFLAEVALDLDLGSDAGKLGFALTAIVTWATNPGREDV